LHHGRAHAGDHRGGRCRGLVAAPGFRLAVPPEPNSLVFVNVSVRTVDSHTAIYAVAAGLAAGLFAVYLIVPVLAQPPGNARTKQVAAASQEGASASLNRQYTVIAIIGVVIAVIVGLFIGWKTAGLYLVGAVLSAAAGYVGMNIAVRSNLRTAEAARGGLN